MPAPFVQSMKFYSPVQNKEIIICCVVIDLIDYVSLVDQIAQRTNMPDVDQLRAAKYIAALKRSDETEFLFSGFGCRDDVEFLSVIVRGMGVELSQMFLGPNNIPSPSLN